MVSDQLIQEFQLIVKEDYDREISKAEASEILSTLTSYFDLLAKIYHRKQTNNKN